MPALLRRLAAVGVVAAIGIAAAPLARIAFTDTKLKNGLRVIVSEDHAAPVYWDTYPARVSAIMLAQAQAAAKKYWDPARLQIVAVGDATKVTDILAKKGTLEVYDIDGKRIQ